jgi:steroid 5-alpha reductase family enzyme
MMTAFLIALVAAFSLSMALAWRIALSTGRSGWIDAIWSFAVGLGGAAAALVTVGNEPTTRQFLVACLALIWSLRLGIHIALRTARGGGDDPRYAQLKKEWGSDFRNRLFWFLQIQAAVAFVLALSLMAAGHNPAPAISLGDQAGIALLLIAVAGEALADRQLSTFRADPGNEGKVCDVGVWGVSRHPNYFFEWVGWLAYAVIAVDPAGAYPWGWAALAGPALMYWLLVHVSGIPPIEAHMLRSRGERFRRYQARVNAFWPGPPKPAAAMKGR